MALFSTYTKPGVYTTVVYQDAGVSLFGSARIPVMIGEGQEFTTVSNQEMHRGSSNAADEQMVLEDLSPQIDGNTRTFKTTYGPVVTGDGTGTVTNNVQYLKAFTVDAGGNLVPLTVTSLNGADGSFQLANILELGVDQLKVSYFFKRMDTRINGQDLSYQIPVFATWAPVAGGGTPGPYNPGLTVTTALPGNVGNNVSLAFTLAQVGVVDALAVSGIGTDLLSVELRKVDGTIRTYGDIINLFNAGVASASAGDLVASTTSALTTNCNAAPATNFTGGQGQNTNTIFQVENLPVVDGSNGGVVINDPTQGNFIVTVNGVGQTVTALDGTHGLFTLVSGVKPGQTLKVSFYTNTYQNSYDILPSSGVSAISSIGYAPGRNDFVEGVDYVLDNDCIYWGNCFVAADGVSTPGYVPFDGVVVIATIKDEMVWMVSCGLGDNHTTTFSLPDVPVTKNGQILNDPTQVQVFVGSAVTDAMISGPVRVVRLDGAGKSLTLYTPPGAGEQVFASYYRNTLTQNSYTLTVLSAGALATTGTYNVKDQNNHIVPAFNLGAYSVADAGFAALGSGIVWPFGESDLQGIAGATPNETITLTFQDDGLTTQVSPAIQATTTMVDSNSKPLLVFRASNSGLSGNGSTIVFSGTTPVLDSGNVVTVTGEVITVNVLRTDGATTPNVTTRSLADIVALFNVAGHPVTTPHLGTVLCSPASASVSSALASTLATSQTLTFGGGANAVTRSYANRFKVTSSRTAADQLADGLGITGGLNGSYGYLGQTFQDWNTGVKFTLVDPRYALAYGYTTLPANYAFAAGDTLSFVVDATQGLRSVSGSPVAAIPGLDLQVNTTHGMHVGDTYVISTYNNGTANQPALGEFYYVTYTVGKTAADFAYHNYSNLSDVIAAYGPVTPDNRLSLGAQLFFQNGGTALGIRQVKKQTGMATASDQDYMAAIAEFTMPLPGTDQKADLFIPMTTSPTVLQFLAKQLTVQASPRMRGEAIAVMGLPVYASADSAQLLAQGLSSERCRLLWPGSAILSLTINNVATEYAVDGSFLAAAYAGLALAASNDVATTLTTQQLVGFDHLNVRTPEPVLDQLASSGVTVLVEVPGALEIRHDLTTSTNGVLMSEPYTTTTVDYTRKRMRATLKQFVGRKSVQALLTDIQIAANGLLQSLVSQELLDSFKPVVVTSDSVDPTVVHVTATIKPQFSVLWIDVTFNVTTTS